MVLASAAFLLTARDNLRVRSANGRDNSRLTGPDAGCIEDLDNINSQNLGISWWSLQGKTRRSRSNTYSQPIFSLVAAVNEKYVTK